jgi:UDP-N-acetylglucosamine 2-epimerase (non-hydrolysing)
MAPLVKAFEKETDNFDMKVCVTAQHREMLDQVLQLFDIQPHYDLDIMKSGQDLYDITSKVLLGMRDVLDDFKPDVVLVHGDTTTTLGASLASFYQKIAVGHVEAGLRTGDIYSPWPEEANRCLTSQISKYHFAPTQTNKNNLLNEGITSHIVITGNTVIDTLFMVRERLANDTKLADDITQQISTKGYKISDRKVVLVTGHRRENFGDGFLSICSALKDLAQSHTDVDFVYPVHLNPNVQKPVKELLSEIDNIHLIDPLQYEEFIYLMDKSYMIITDSGGIQEEAPSLGKPVLVMRDTTERPEAVSSGTVKLVGTDTNTIVQETQKLLDNKSYYDMMSKANNPYGDGKASQKIVDFLREVKSEK